MNILRKTLNLTLIIGCFICSANFANAQAKNAIGLGLGFNYSNKNGNGPGGVFQGEIKLDKSVSLTPSVGLEEPYIFYAGLAGRYYFSPVIYGSLGGFAYHNVDYGGAGAAAGIGFMLLIDHRQTFDINIHGNYLNNNYENDSPIVGIRLIYSFSFNKLYR
ncbi:MAG TPA: hypothetical protein VK609_18275 [Mucilaginibacter sp.]|nr:hypothetical protein [Mucilaginibacter sp.]